MSHDLDLGLELFSCPTVLGGWGYIGHVSWHSQTKLGKNMFFQKASVLGFLVRQKSTTFSMDRYNPILSKAEVYQPQFCDKDLGMGAIKCPTEL